LPNAGFKTRTQYQVRANPQVPPPYSQLDHCLGHVEEQVMTEHAFRTQHLTHNILGYSQNPSNDPSAPRFVGSISAGEANGFDSIDSTRPSKASRRELKRKRAGKGDVEVVEGEDAYVGPWAGWQGENDLPPELQDVPDGLEEDEEDAPQVEAAKRKAAGRKSTFGQETSIFHGRSLTDYQGRTYMAPPLAAAPHLTYEGGEQECFIPKACIHTFTGHTAGVSVIRTFPKTGHLMLSGSMDKKIKASYFEHPSVAQGAHRISSPPAVGCISGGQLLADVHGAQPSREGRDVL
jgi:pre-mRNA-processing factor 17